MKAILTLSCLLLSFVATAADTGRRYDKDNNFNGTYRVTESGTIRLYDEKGNFEGTVVPGRDKGTYKRYDENNNYQGTDYDDEAED
jgi:hypothetical protein